MVVVIGKALGKLEEHELTTSSARIRVCFNGLQPLIQETIIDFENGDEATVVLVYERLKSCCKLCFCLTHDEPDCPRRDKS